MADVVQEGGDLYFRVVAVAPGEFGGLGRVFELGHVFAVVGFGSVLLEKGANFGYSFLGRTALFIIHIS